VEDARPRGPAGCGAQRRGCVAHQAVVRDRCDDERNAQHGAEARREPRTGEQLAGGEDDHDHAEVDVAAVGRRDRLRPKDSERDPVRTGGGEE
jgi:hypothetical protein